MRHHPRSLPAIGSLALAAATFLGPAQAAFGQSLFQLRVEDTSGGQAPLTVGSSSLIDLTKDLVDTKGQFARFDGTDFRGTLQYAGVPDAVMYTQDAGRTRATLQLLGRPPRTFDAANGDISDQIEDYLKKEGSSDLRAFFKEINQRSLVAVTDGNPLASTARAADYKYSRFGLFAEIGPRWPSGAAAPIIMEPGRGAGLNQGGVGPDRVLDRGLGRDDMIRGGPAPAGPSDRIPDRQPAITPTQARGATPAEGFDDRGFMMRLQGFSGVFNSDSGDGTTISLAPTFGYRFNRRVAAVIGVPMSYHQVENADVFNLGVHLDVPVRVMHPAEADGWLWQLTPGAMASASGSYDMVAGGVFWGAGLTSFLGYQWDNWSLGWASNATYIQGVNLSAGDYEFDPGVDQVVVKNGVKAVLDFSERWYGYGALTLTNFLDDAAVQEYISPNAGIGYGTGRFNINIGYQGDFGDGYTAHQARINLQFGF